MMRLMLAAVAGIALLGLLATAADLSAAEPAGKAPATMPAGSAAPDQTSGAEGSYAYIVPSKPGGERKGGLTIVESPLMADGAKPSLGQENVALRRQVETLQIQINVMRDQIARSNPQYDIIRAALREGLPLNGDVATWVCEYGPGHPTLCPSKYIVTSLAPPAPVEP